MAYIYPISGYKPLYIQTENDTTAQDTTQWGMIVKSAPYALLPEAKDCYKNDWKDEDGDDEYNEEMHYKAFTVDFKFIVKTFSTTTTSAESVMRSQIEDFFQKIKNGEFMIYDSYSGLGRQGVRYVGYQEESFTRSDNWARCVFTITLKVNDPVTRVVYSNGVLVAQQ